ncbi:MAG: MBL fold metallo-hydrolase, partial [Coraliomargarita sp.]
MHTHTTLFTRSMGLLLTTSIAIANTQVEPALASQMLAAQDKQFEQQVVQVTDNVFTAVGFHGANTSMIVGDDGVVIVDPGQLPTASTLLRQEFEKITDKPVRAIIYTHGHNDHTNGAIAFYEEDKD